MYYLRCTDAAISKRELVMNNDPDEDYCLECTEDANCDAHAEPPYQCTCKGDYCVC